MRPQLDPETANVFHGIAVGVLTGAIIWLAFILAFLL
jgi:hypothetical protein